MIVAQIGENGLAAQSGALSRVVDGLRGAIGFVCSGVIPAVNLVESAPWMDDIKHCTHALDPWHYVDSNVDAPFSVPSTSCVNVVSSVENMEADYLAGRNKSFTIHALAHLVGDIHQPLHCADRGDRGGNDFLLNGHSNLHRLWDEGLGMYPHDLSRPLSDEHRNYLRDFAADLEKAYPRDAPPMRQRLQKHTPYEWATESHDIARDHVYQGISEHTIPTPDYLRDNYEIVRQQLAVAGYRLTDMLAGIHLLV